MPDELTAQCECEHSCHFADSPIHEASDHLYGVFVKKEDLVEVQSEYGLFMVCKKCWNDCCNGGMF